MNIKSSCKSKVKWKRNIIKNTKKDFEKKHVKNIKIFLKKKKTKRWKKALDRHQIFNYEEKEKRCQYYQEHKQKLPEYRRNYYITH